MRTIVPFACLAGWLCSCSGPGSEHVPDLPAGWTRIEPGGETVCSRGTPYAFWVRPGTVNRVLVYLEGGGACWDALTCGMAGAIFRDAVAEGNAPPRTTGIFDFENGENPFRDWYVVFVPYCTGDAHWGNRVAIYPGTGDSPEVTIHHTGFINASSATGWLYGNFSGPDFIFVAGCSAGSYGSFLHAPYIMEHYPNSRAAQLGDSGAAVAPLDFVPRALRAWGAEPNIPGWIPELATTPVEELTMAKALVAGSRYYPQQRLSEFNYASDKAQMFIYAAMGGQMEDWPGLLEEQTQAIAADAPNFRFFTAASDAHCVLPAERFYTSTEEGVRLRDWVADMAAGREVPNVHCVDCAGKSNDPLSLGEGEQAAGRSR
ncbi:MAG: pectinesterase [Nitrospirae bacterium]|nr:pectinesterase [Nitrospirota bacterium]